MAELGARKEKYKAMENEGKKLLDSDMEIVCSA